MFKKKKLETIDDEINIKEATDTTLRSEFHEAIEQYGKGVGFKWKLTIPDIDDAMIVAQEREYVHQIFLELQNRNIEPSDLNKLKQYDAQWQAFIITRLPIDMTDHKAIYINRSTPKKQWWFWIEELNDLSDEERSTL